MPIQSSLPLPSDKYRASQSMFNEHGTRTMELGKFNA